MTNPIGTPGEREQKFAGELRTQVADYAYALAMIAGGDDNDPREWARQLATSTLAQYRTEPMP